MFLMPNILTFSIFPIYLNCNVYIPLVNEEVGRATGTVVAASIFLTAILGHSRRFIISHDIYLYCEQIFEFLTIFFFLSFFLGIITKNGRVCFDQKDYTIMIAAG